MAGSVFLDTNGWISLLNASEKLHKEANDLWLQLGRKNYRIVLTDWIIAETGNGLTRSSARTHFADALDRIWRNPRVELIVVDMSLIARAMDLYNRYSDKSWGLVDCASFVVMRDRGIDEAFTSDRDFLQAGFQCLLTS